jgi:hypothetical protein
MKCFTVLAAVLLCAAFAHADSGTIAPGSSMDFGNIRVANFEGAGGDVNFTDNGTLLVLAVHADAVCAAVKRGPATQARRVRVLVLGDGYYAQGNVSGARITVLGDHAVALALAFRPRHVCNGNTIELLGNGNLAAAARWCYGEGEVKMNHIRFGANALLTGSDNDAYISGDREGTRDLAWANRTLDVAGTGNESIAFDGFGCPDDDGTDDKPAVAVDASRLAAPRG